MRTTTEAKPCAVPARGAAALTKWLASGLAWLAFGLAAAVPAQADGDAAPVAAVACAGKGICLCNRTGRCYAVLEGSAGGAGGVYRSPDGGAKWEKCAAQPAGPQVHSLAMDGAGRLYAESEQDFFVSADNCTSWTVIDMGVP
jgi:hypothetical protein